mgnify:CR=1 FL=1|jgi:uncharacterized protein (TIGR03032 family)
MQLNHPFIRLPISFDNKRLQEEVEAIEEQAWQPHPQGFAGNSALLLIARDGDPRDDALNGQMAPTPNLDRMPYLRQVMASLKTTWGRSRLMRIDGNAEANRHMDANYYWHQRVRVHVPLVTTPNVDFLCGDSRVHMAAGECWIFDTWAHHNVINPDPTRRIHLVADTVGSAHFWQMVARGTPHSGQERRPPNADLPLVPWDPQADPLLAFERYNAPGIMSPWEMRSLADHILSDLAPQDASAVTQARRLVDDYIHDWHALWAIFADQPEGLPLYQQRRDQFAEALKTVSDLPLGNNMRLGGMLLQALVNPVINPELLRQPSATPATQDSGGARYDAPAIRHETFAVADAARRASPAPGPAPAPARFERPVFIVAAPRSGSSWLYELMSQSTDFLSLGGEGHGHVESIPGLGVDPTSDRGNALDASDASDDAIGSLKANYIATMKNAAGEPVTPRGPFRFLEKTPKNALRVAFLKKAFPDARFIYLHRDPQSNIASIIEAWHSGRFVTYPQLPGRDQPWSLLLPQGWQAMHGKSVPETAAWQWARANQAILEALQAMPDSDWCHVSYADLKENTDETLAALCQFAGVSTPDAVDDGALSRHTLTPPKKDKWRKHEADINASRALWAPIADTLAALPAHGSDKESAPMTETSNTNTPATPAADTDTASGDAGTTQAQAPDFSSVHTNTLHELLERGNLSLVATTYQAGKLIFVRKQDGKVNTHFRMFHKPMGLAGSREGFAIGTLNEIQEFRNVPAVAQRIEPAGSHDACYIPRSKHTTGDIDIHEMSYDKDGELWFINTRFSCLCTLDKDNSFVPRWRPPFVTGYAPEDRCHLNGLAMRDGVPRYVTMLGQTNEMGGWRENKRDGGLLMDLDDERIIATGLSMPHSPRWYKDKLWLLESGYGSLSTIDPDSGEKTDICHLPGFTRGLSFIGDYAVIGLSQVRESAVFSGLPLTERDEPRYCGIWIVNINTGKTEAFLRFEGSVQEIFAVHVLENQTFPELLEPHDPLINSSYVLPDEALREVDFASIERHQKEAREKAAQEKQHKEAAGSAGAETTDGKATAS